MVEDHSRNPVRLASQWKGDAVPRVSMHVHLSIPKGLFAEGLDKRKDISKGKGNKD